jgi:hypothetical protein
MGESYTIRIFVPDGDPEGLRIIDRMNWTGLGIVFPRESWLKIRQRLDFGKPGVYILLGYVSGDVVRTRIDTHVQTKDFWNKAVVFVPTPDAPDVYSPVKNGWVSPGRFEDSGGPVAPRDAFRQRKDP